MNSGTTRAGRVVALLIGSAVLAGCGVTPPYPVSPTGSASATPSPPPPATPPAASPLVVPPAPVSPTPGSSAPTPSNPPTPAPSPTPSTSPTITPQPSRKANCRKAKCIALTFDDGPGPYTLTLLDHLKRANVPATFFMLGDRVKTYPRVARAVADARHEIGVHTWDHPMLTRLEAEQVRREIISSIRIVKRTTGTTPTLMRPPYGETDASVATEASRAKVAQILWNTDTLDWKTRDTDKTVAAALRLTRRGSILLLHDIHATSVAAVPRIIEELREQGYTFVTVGNLLGKTKPGRVYSHG